MSRNDALAARMTTSSFPHDLRNSRTPSALNSRRIPAAGDNRDQSARMRRQTTRGRCGPAPTTTVTQIKDRAAMYTAPPTATPNACSNASTSPALTTRTFANCSNQTNNIRPISPTAPRSSVNRPTWIPRRDPSSDISLERGVSPRSSASLSFFSLGSCSLLSLSGSSDTQALLLLSHSLPAASLSIPPATAGAPPQQSCAVQQEPRVEAPYCFQRVRIPPCVERARPGY